MTPPLPARHLFLDLDGTLTDPRDGIVRCIQFALTELDVVLPPERELERLIGPPLHDSFRALLGPERAHHVPRAVDLYRSRFRTDGMFENRVYPGVPEALTRLASAGFTLHVVTSKPHVFAKPILHHFGLHAHFRAVHGSELSGERADKSHLIRHVLATERIAAETAVMIGDRSHDIVAARTNGLRSLGVLWGYGSRAELEGAGADALYSSIEALVDDLAVAERARPL